MKPLLGKVTTERRTAPKNFLGNEKNTTNGPKAAFWVFLNSFRADPLPAPWKIGKFPGVACGKQQETARGAMKGKHAEAGENG